MDFTQSVSYTDAATKNKFHREAAKSLRSLAKELNIATFDIRSNKGGIAVSGEIILHSDTLYIQVSQFAFSRSDEGILIRSCKGRKDYTGGTNTYASLNLLNDIPTLAQTIRRRGLA